MPEKQYYLYFLHSFTFDFAHWSSLRSVRTEDQNLFAEKTTKSFRTERNEPARALAKEGEWSRMWANGVNIIYIQGQL